MARKTKVRISKCYLVQVIDMDGNELDSEYIFGDKEAAVEAGQDLQTSRAEYDDYMEEIYGEA